MSVLLFSLPFTCPIFFLAFPLVPSPHRFSKPALLFPPLTCSLSRYISPRAGQFANYTALGLFLSINLCSLPHLHRVARLRPCGPTMVVLNMLTSLQTRRSRSSPLPRRIQTLAFQPKATSPTASSLNTRHPQASPRSLAPNR